ncbi:hypothetical protein EYF80_040748 [Liparis tanakae]|uniref:Uncharacterized protein n=1 Tax=Liparis tanakae TaxID=230148 RepID=A0A4Z2G7D6_9TELE|nr:hypothetical protein EYF80_040748 [Liparis tanakae]
MLTPRMRMVTTLMVTRLRTGYSIIFWGDMCSPCMLISLSDTQGRMSSRMLAWISSRSSRSRATQNRRLLMSSFFRKVLTYSILSRATRTKYKPGTHTDSNNVKAFRATVSRLFRSALQFWKTK